MFSAVVETSQRTPRATGQRLTRTLPERLELIGCFSNGDPGSGPTSHGWNHSAVLSQKTGPAKAAATADRNGSSSSSSFHGAILVDPGPLVAWFFFLEHTGAFVSTKPILTEVCHPIPADEAQRFLSWIALGGLSVPDLTGSALEVLASWMRQYGDLPMDLADASLLWLTHELGLRSIATLDRRDFGVDQLPGGEALGNLLEA